VGSGWHAPEFEQYGLEFGDTAARLRWLGEALPVMRGMLDGTRPSSAGEHFAVREAFNVPAPIQARLPILVAGAGPKVTLRLVAEYADICNFMGTPEFLAERDAVLVRHCEAIGRDEREIERTMLVRSPILRDSAAEAEREQAAIFEHQGIGEGGPPGFAGTPESFIEFCEPYLDIGFHHLIFGWLAPYDRESMERIATEMRPRLAAHAAR